MSTYLLRGFQSEEAARSRSRDIAVDYGIGTSPESVTKYIFDWRQIGEDEWALVIPERLKHMLSEKEIESSRFVELRRPKSWQIRTPTVYRYLKHKHIDQFFDSGELRLSSFSQFSKHEDEQRKDTQEGSNILTVSGKDQTMFAVTQHGHDAYILSGSVIHSEDLLKAFDCDGCIKIKNTVAFGTAVGGAIDNSIGGLEGFCIYQDDRVIRKSAPDFDVDDLRHSEVDQNLDMQKLFGAVFQIAGPDVFFTKLRKYQHQLEYRFVWIVEGEAEDHIFIECPEAVQFCEKVT